MKKPVVLELIIWLIILSILFGVGVFAHYNFFVKPNLYVIDFIDIDGITKGSPVRLMGMNIGYVRKLISKDKHIKAQIIVTKKNLKIPKGTTARVEFYGLGGSKSIELMPGEDVSKSKISTEKTIRLNDVARETKGLVEIIEMVEKYTKGLNRAGMQKFLERVEEMKNQDIDDVGKRFDEVGNDITRKVEEVTQKQDEVTIKIKKVNENVVKINKFIKK